MRVCVLWYARLFGVLRENALCAYDIRYAGHYEKSLYSDNDPRYYSREMKIISSDWIAPLRRLLMILTISVQDLTRQQLPIYGVKCYVIICQYHVFWITLYYLNHNQIDHNTDQRGVKGTEMGYLYNTLEIDRLYILRSLC